MRWPFSRLCFSIAICCGMALLSGCAVVDRFSPRAVDYNREAEKAQSQVLLLNVIRASLRRPMQFTTLQTVTGSATESGGAQLSLPFGPHPHPSPTGLQLTDSMSGGPTFTVPVLDTQEFYNGILTPITAQEFDYFIAQGYMRALVFYLFVQRIDVTVLRGDKVIDRESFSNAVGSDYEFNQFEVVLDYLLSLGMTMEPLEHVTDIGPPLSAAKVSTLDALVKADAAGLKLRPVQGGKEYQLAKSETTHALCFNPPAAEQNRVPPSLICNARATAPGQQGGKSFGESAAFSIAGIDTRPVIDELSEVRGRYARGPRPHSIGMLPPDARIHLQLITRSTESVIHYLGDIVERYLTPPPGVSSRTIQIKVGPPDLPYPRQPCLNQGPTSSPIKNPSYACQNLFFVQDKFDGGAALLAVDYDGRTYRIPAEAALAGWSSRALDMVKQLLAVHTSAKELPAPNVLSIISP